MSAPRFVHLRLHTEYSVVDGMARVDEAVGAAAADGMPALAITDLANVFGAVKFYEAARARGVQPIIGCDAWITNDKNRDAAYRVALLCRSREGYLGLCDLLTRAYAENQWRGRAEMRREWLRGARGLLVLSGAGAGDVGMALASGNAEHAEELASAWARDFPGAFYVELQRVDPVKSASFVQASVALAAKVGLPVVATHPIQFLRPDDFQAHETRVCIAQGYVLGDPRRPRDFHPAQYFKAQAEMAELFHDLSEAVENAVQVARRCSFEFVLGKSRLPNFPTPNGESIDEYLKIESLRGLEKRLAVLYPDEAARERERPRYLERLEYETRTIVQMGFPGYFLIVADFIGWAKSNGVPVGPGRGSGAGSLVAYSLGITDLDPLKYDLLFERFLNPERVSMPDFDIDFCQDGRDRVIDYVRRKYGAESVSQIATFGTMAAKAVVRDVGRVLGMGYGEVDRIAKLIPFELGMTLEKALEVEPQLKQLVEENEEVASLMRLARALEGLTRNVGMHAGGVLIAPGKLTDFTPLYCAEGSAATVSQFDKDDVEKAGLVKFDFLGLTTLTILAEAQQHIRRLWTPDFDIQSIPLDDAPSYKIFSSGNTVAIFQFESRGMRDLIMKAKPDRLEDLIALNALYRPGPMDLIPDFIERKHGRQRWDYLDPRMKDILDETYGVMTYQEQVMQMAQVIGGYTLGGADLLRRAMGKKKPEEMAQHRDIFVAGAEKNGLARAKAAQLFDLMEKFAGYGFNKSHSAAYALVAYQTAYFKAHHPAAFMAANLSLVMDDTDKLKTLYDDALAQGLEILPPDVNASRYRFEPVDPRRIRYGLGGIKGTGSAAIEAIVAAREAQGAFTDLFDFCRRVDKRLVNRRVVEALVRAGAFDVIDSHRAALFALVGLALDAGERAAATASQVSLFGEDVAPPVPAGPPMRDWTEAERLVHEKASLGFYLSGHPFNAHAAELATIVRTALSSLQPKNERVLVAGIVTALRVQTSRRGKMAFVTLDDGKGRAEVMVYNETFDAARALLREDQLVVMEIRVMQRMTDDGESQGLRIIAENIYDLGGVRKRWAKSLRIACNGNASADRLEEILRPFRPGTLPVTVRYVNARIGGELDLPESWRVTPDDALIERLREWLAPENVQVVY